MLNQNIVVAIVCLFLLTSCSSQAITGFVIKENQEQQVIEPQVEPITLKWTILHFPVDYFLQAAEAFKESLETRSNGELTIEIILPNGHKGSDAQNPEMMIVNGETDIMQIGMPDLIQYNPDLEIIATPYLFTNDNHVDLVVDGPIGDKLLQDIDNTHIMGLAFTYSGGFLDYIAYNFRPESLSDIQGKQIYDFQLPYTKILERELGLVPRGYDPETGTREDYDEAFQNWSLDLEERTPADAVNQIKDGRTVIDSNHRVKFTALMINRHFFEGLSKEHQEFVRLAARDAAKAERHAISADGENILKSHPSNVIELTEEDKALLTAIKEKTIKENLQHTNLQILAQIEQLKP